MFKVNDLSDSANCFYIHTDAGNKYCVKLDETSSKSNIWIINFILINGEPSKREVFTTLKTGWTYLKKFLIEKNAQSAFGYIDGKDREERDQKTKIFTRWIDYPFTFEVDDNPEIRVQGIRGSYYMDTNFIHVKRIPGSKVEQINSSTIENKIDSETIITKNIKFCFECGLENKNYKFCPNCGTRIS